MLTIDNIQVGYGSCVVARHEGESAFAKAELTAILGTNGAGKSTLLRSLHNGSHLLNGNIRLEGLDINNWNPTERSRKIAVVLTERHFSYFLKVRELLELSRSPYTNFLGKLQPLDHERIHAVMQSFDLESLFDRRLGTLSDGQLQRVLIARAMVQDTEYLLMDEPTSHLDINHKADLMFELREYCHETGRSMIYASHEIQLALALSDKILTIHQGQIDFFERKELTASEKLEKMFPSDYLAFQRGDIKFNFPK
ncbi:ABC transporter ATP-binding protein [Nonlabens xiamenensis]|uniref:ABC transporter ATP-binding protein n=1 Tax=Nonlabens xiamenensis TaxID=2341043 RepID=UPI000F606940|nr:ABC transporter ATP-binding protein [Nonlabens xiamenensis]